MNTRSRYGALRVFTTHFEKKTEPREENVSGKASSPVWKKTKPRRTPQREKHQTTENRETRRHGDTEGAL